MKAVAIFTCLVTAGWIAVGGVVALIAHTAVMEVIALELAALVLVLLGGLLLFDDVLGPRT